MANRTLILLLLIVALAPPSLAQEKRWIEGMWSDPPVTMIGSLCAGHCSDVALNALNELLDDPKNDSRPVQQLLQTAARRHDAYVRAHLLPELLKATKTTGKQSAVMIAKARLQLTLIEASATGGVVPDDIASLASLASNTSQPCTWFNHTTGAPISFSTKLRRA